MTRRTTEDYIGILNFVKARYPAIFDNVTSVMADLEQASRLAVQATMPRAVLRACWSHYARVSSQIQAYIPGLYFHHFHHEIA